ncbi:MAG: ribosome small subunit-dependent GTPase A [Acidobacteria bacterium]|nr:MAG: ribosome small subunit-dependent GTPase A [Acidobacteriota bacterium]RLE22823.1 MAG: ribosome small subunit-dependent GTPase A [Acidobacteriota bacterium]
MNRQNMEELNRLGWGRYQLAMQPNLVKSDHVGRVTAESKRYYFLSDGKNEYLAEVSGKLLHRTTGLEDFPAVGDWVLFQTPESKDRAAIHRILPRHTTLKRRAVRSTEEAQVIAANLDSVFIIYSVDENFKSGKLDRFLAIVHESGAIPVVVLSKADLMLENREAVYREVLAMTSGVSIVMLSAKTGEGVDSLLRHLEPGSTCCMIGPSGAGKSTLLNFLAGSEVAKTADVREFDMKGRHTTTKRELFVLKNGQILIDTPGIREVGLVVGDNALSSVFPDVAAIAKHCRFRNCTHHHEPGCAVLAAISSGELDPGKVARYLKLKAEVMEREDGNPKDKRIAKKRHAKRIHKAFRKSSGKK